MATNWRATRDYREWRAGVIRRDVVCRLCHRGPEDGIERHAHHLDHATYFIEKRFDVENGITLCSMCHSHFHNDYKNSYREKCTRKDYEEFEKIKTYFLSISCSIMMREIARLKLEPTPLPEHITKGYEKKTYKGKKDRQLKMIYDHDTILVS